MANFVQRSVVKTAVRQPVRADSVAAMFAEIADGAIAVSPARRAGTGSRPATETPRSGRPRNPGPGR
jgi:hypothetical protein